MQLLAKSSFDQLCDDYDGFELYLSEEMYRNNTVEDVLEKIGDENIEVIHTPHLYYEEYEDGLRYCNRLACELEASVVCHSSYIKPLMANGMIDFGVLECDYGIENHCGLSVSQIESVILDEGHDLVLDVAHLYVTDEGLYKRNLAYILHEYSDRISNIHLCDSTPESDGLHIGEGTLDVEHTLNSIMKSDYDESVVVEVPVEGRENSIRKVREIASESEFEF